MVSSLHSGKPLNNSDYRYSPTSQSGSPVMDETGQVIGIETLVSAEGQKLNFAIPVEEVPAEVLEPPGSSSNLPMRIAECPPNTAVPWNPGEPAGNGYPSPGNEPTFATVASRLNP
jgi:hypothetical protein